MAVPGALPGVQCQPADGLAAVGRRTGLFLLERHLQASGRGIPPLGRHPVGVVLGPYLGARCLAVPFFRRKKLSVTTVGTLGFSSDFHYPPPIGRILDRGNPQGGLSPLQGLRKADLGYVGSAEYFALTPD